MRPVRAFATGMTPIIAIAGGIALGAWLLRASIVRRASAEESTKRLSVATTKADQGEFEVVVTAVGKLEAVNSKQVAAKVWGQVVWVIPNGVEVEEGDIIAELDAARMLRRVREQETRYREALDDFENRKRDLAAEVEKARIGLERARLELEKYQAEQGAEIADKESRKTQDTENLALSRERFERQKRLATRPPAGEGLVPLREVELAEARLKAQEFGLERETKDLELAQARRQSEELDKEAEIKEAEADLERAKSRQEDEIKDAEINLEIRKTQLDRVRSEFEKSVIRAPAAGIVVLAEQHQGRGTAPRPVQPGDDVWEGRSIATIPDLSEMRVLLEIAQEQARQVKRKQEARVIVEAIPGRVLPGEVTEVSQTAQESSLPGTGIPSGQRSFQVRVDVTDLEGVSLRPGMTAQVRIIVDRVPDAVSVPLECVFEQDERHIVYLRRGTDFVPTEIELGHENDDAVIVTKGLKGGEELALRAVGASEEPGPDASEDTPSSPLPG